MSMNPRALMLAATLMVASPLLAANLPNPTLDETRFLAQAQEMQDRTRPEKRAFIEQQLTLSPQQAERFWPVYDERQVALGELDRRRIENILSYARAWNQGSLDDKTANTLAKEVIAIEEDEVALLKRTYRHASKATSPAQAALYVQIEAKLRARQRFEETEMPAAGQMIATPTPPAPAVSSAQQSFGGHRDVRTANPARNARHCLRRKSAWWACSTPSATRSSESALPISMMSRATCAVTAPVPIVSTKDLSILSRVDLEVLQVREVGVAGAEVVDRHVYAKRADLLQHVRRGFLFHHAALGGLDGEVDRLQAARG